MTLSNRKTVLVVDDEKPVREALTRVLSGEDYNVLDASGCRDAEDHVVHSQVDIVLLDVNLNGELGWDLLPRLKARGCAAPVVMMTARPEETTQSSSSHFATIIAKPFELPLLLALIRRLLTGAPGQSATAATTELTAPEESLLDPTINGAFAS